MASISPKIGNTVTLATANALTGTVDGSQYLDVSGARAVVIAQLNYGTDGTAGIDVIEISRDAGKTWLAATAANIAQGHGGLRRASDGTAITNAALNAAGTEAATIANTLFFLRGPFGKAMIRCARGGAGAGGTAWVTGSPAVVAVVIG